GQAARAGEFRPLQPVQLGGHPRREHHVRRELAEADADSERPADPVQREHDVLMCTRHTRLRGLAAAAVIAAAAAVAVDAQGPRAPGAASARGFGGPSHWVGTWATALVMRAPAAAAGPGAPPLLNFNNQTLRQIVRVSIGGPQVRAVFSNAFGTAPLAIGGAAIALRDKGAAVVPVSSRTLTFSG